VFFTGLTIHGSYANRSPDRARRAFATHYVAEGTWVFRTDVQQTVPAR
jgi:ectoine hydroxylase-related dioxygenase (phytanoyl-CoA dioxygenase family)